MLVATSEACLGHDPGPPEGVARLQAVLDRLTSDARHVPIEAPLAAPDSLHARHPASHVAMLERHAAAGLPAGEEVPLGPGSWPAILGAVGALNLAVEYAMTGRGHAFAAVRPPGHHASAGVAMGFCAVNTVALASSRARELGAQRILIVDWDVHHGNGTQSIVEAEADTRFVSMHQAPWYPGTGAAEERGVGNLFNRPLPPGLPPAHYVEALWSAVVTATDGWGPELVLISAGYDCLAGDPLGGFTLEPADCATWVTRMRERWPSTPIVATMEGGYLPERLADGVLATARALAE